MTSLTKKGETQNQKIFFRCKLRLIFAESFEGLNSSVSSTIDWRLMELQSSAKLGAQCMIFRNDIFLHWQ